MPQITYIEASGRTHVVEVPLGHNLMEGSRGPRVEGILGECGGACACATCHVHVAEDWFSRLPEIADMERDMLDFATGLDPLRSRLSCQIRVTPEMDGLVVTVPDELP